MILPPSPAALPPRLRNDHRVREALARRDVGAVFALAHAEAGISFNKISEACGIRAERIGRWHAGMEQSAPCPSWSESQMDCSSPVGTWVWLHGLGRLKGPQPAMKIREMKIQ